MRATAFHKATATTYSRGGKDEPTREPPDESRSSDSLHPPKRVNGKTEICSGRSAPRAGSCHQHFGVCAATIDRGGSTESTILARLPGPDWQRASRWRK